MNLDDELRAALRREDPSPGFTQRVIAGRVVARAQSTPAPKASRRPAMLWAAAIAAMLVVGFTAESEYRQMKAERAGRDAVLALRIAAEKLNMTRDKIHRLEN
jgi:hypothetical protein